MPTVAVLGAGPIGLDAALAAREAGHDVIVYEAAPHVAGAVRSWGHVRLFTPWPMNASQRARGVLAEAGHALPENGYPTGAELAESLLEPLAALPTLADSLRLGAHVRGVGRRGLLKHEAIGDADRAARPFRLLLGDAAGREWTEEADVVLDCTGNVVPNALGDGGVPAPGEAATEPTVRRRIPDLTREAADWAGRRILVVGSGHSALTALRDLLELAEREPETRVVWLRRGSDPPLQPEDDPLPERAALERMACELCAAPPENLELASGTVEAFHKPPGGVEVEIRKPDGEHGTLEVDRILALVGLAPDHLLHRQLQVHECYATSGPMKLAAALLGASGAGGDCLDQTSLGPDTLRNPEPGFFILGRKSYGRRNDFLLRVGYEQVDEVMTLL